MWPFCAAMNSGVAPSLLGASTLALAASSSSTTAVRPSPAAVNRGVRPSWWGASTLAFAESSSSTTEVCP